MVLQKFAEKYSCHSLTISVSITAPNCYTLPFMIGKTVQSSKRQAPVYTLRGRAKVGSFSEDLHKVIGTNCHYWLLNLLFLF